MKNQDSSSAMVEQVPDENPDVQTTDGVATTGEITHHSVDGVIYRELKTLHRVVIKDGPHAGMDEQVIFETRFIGDLTYHVDKILLHMYRQCIFFLKNQQASSLLIIKHIWQLFVVHTFQTASKLSKTIVTIHNYMLKQVSNKEREKKVLTYCMRFLPLES